MNQSANKSSLKLARLSVLCAGCGAVNGCQSGAMPHGHASQAAPSARLPMPATEPAAIVAAPATEPVATAPPVVPATQPAAAEAPTTVPATLPAVAELPATAPSTRPVVAEIPATAPSAPATEPAATQPTTAPSAAVADQSAPTTAPSTMPTTNASTATTEPSTEPTTRPATAGATTGPATRPAMAMAATGPTTHPTTQPAATQPAVASAERRNDRYDRSRSDGRPSYGQPPTAPPALLPGQAKPLPKSYYVLLGRDIFTEKPYRTPTGYDVGENPPPPPRPPETNPSTHESRPDNYPSSVEYSLALMGVAVDDGKYVAFVEDLNSVKTAFYKVGDLIARGKIKQIDFDHLEYERGTMVQRVEIGQNLSGQAVSVGTPPPTVLSSAPTAPSAPGAVPAPAPAVGARIAAPSGADDIVERMRRRRQQENGGR